MEDGAQTNMTLLTNKHSYQFDLKSLAADAKSGGNIYVARFIYPDDEAMTITAAKTNSRPPVGETPGPPVMLTRSTCRCQTPSIPPPAPTPSCSGDGASRPVPAKNLNHPASDRRLIRRHNKL